MNLAAELRKVGLFSEVKAEIIEEIALPLTRVNFQCDETVITKGDWDTDLCIVLSGSFRAVLKDEDGSEIILSRFKPYDIFGEFSVIDRKERAGSILADEPSSICKIDSKSFLKLLTAEPEVAISLLKMLVARLRKADSLIESLLFINVRDRIIKYLKGEDIVNSFRETGVKGQLILNAIESKNIVPYFQPIVTMNGKSISAHELLMRIPAYGSIMPAGEFIDEAESMGVVHIMDLMVIEKAFEKIIKVGYEGYLFINLSPKSIMIEEVVDEILKLTEFYGVDRTKIVFEITERETVKDFSLLKKFIKELKAQGFLFAIDDFGSGFSSFHYIKMFPIDFIKIEGEFIKNILNDQVDKAFVKSALTLAEELNIRTVAEFVENVDVLKSLEELGVDYAQGYFIDKPSPDLLENNTLKSF